MTKGIFTISIDVELAWGTFDHKGHINYKDAYEKYRFIITRLLELFEKYNISASWAIVGHLFLDSCKKTNGCLHADIIRPRHRWFPQDWFSYDPGTDISQDKFWYGSDLVKKIKKARPAQEIASHSFCHPVFSDEGCFRQTAESDVAKCVELAVREGIELKSFTFPRNLPGHLDILSKYGFKVFRGKDDVYSQLNSYIIKKFYFLFQDMIGVRPPVILPKKLDNGLIEVPSSMLFRFAHGISRFIPRGVRFKRAKKGIDAAIREKKIFHLWCHPISFAWDSNNLFDEFENILSYAIKFREKGVLDIFPLKEIERLYQNQIIISKDLFNPLSISMHNNRVNLFTKEYSGDLKDYYKSAFQFGRKKIEEALLGFLDDLDKDRFILDVGCGTGYFTNLIRRQGFYCIGIDRSENMIKIGKGLYPDIPVKIADARNLSFADNSFDAVISIEVLRYFQERESLLKEIHRVLKPGGYIFITAAPLFSSNTYGIYNTLCRILNLSRYVSCFQSFETVSSLKIRLETLGFVGINIKGYFFGPFYFFDKINLGINNFLLKYFEGLDIKLSKYNLFKNFSNHLVCIARKPVKI